MSMNFLLNVDEGDLQLIKKRKSEQLPVVKSKKEKKAEKQAKLRAKRAAEGSKVIGDGDDDPTDARRNPFTKGWEERMSSVQSLPVKLSGKVISVSKQEDDDVESNYSEDDGDGIAETNGTENHDRQDESDDEFDFANDVVDYEPDTSITYKSPQSSTGVDRQPKKSPKSVAWNCGNINVVRKKISEICSSVTSAPEKALKRRIHGNEEDEAIPRMVDLFEFFTSPDDKIIELAILSAVLIFKDILPGYRIRPNEELDNSIQLKKETKRVRDFEHALLGAYQRYLKFIDTKIREGLGSPKRDITDWSPAACLGLSALRCQCELLLAVPHFNFRSVLLTSIVARACQLCPEVHGLCCRSLTQVITKDVDGDCSYEIVKTLSKALIAMKYDVPEAVVRCLEVVKVRVHADAAKGIRIKAKQEKRKRKRRGDDVDAGLLAADAQNKSSKLRFQADVLHEICLIYFRIIKQKIGFKLLPAALEGLSRITHLINMDTVEDLLALMRNLLEANAPIAPPMIRLHCVYCALRTLSGPGQELGLDDEVFVSGLEALMSELPSEFERWDVVLDCVDLCLIQRREVRKDRITALVRLLLLCSSHLGGATAATMLVQVNCVLLKYPTIRLHFIEQMYGVPKEEEEVADFAMKALKDEAAHGGAAGAHSHRGGDALSSSGSAYWALTLLRLHTDSRYGHIIHAISGRDVTPLPFRSADAALMSADKIAERADSFMKTMDKKKMSHPAAVGASAAAGGSNGSGKHNSSKKFGSKQSLDRSNKAKATPLNAAKSEHKKKIGHMLSVGDLGLSTNSISSAAVKKSLGEYFRQQP